MMRFVALLVVLAGAAIGIGYPYLVDRMGERPLATLQAFDASRGGALAAEAELEPSAGPVRVDLVLVAGGQPDFTSDASVVTLTVDRAGTTVLAKALDFVDAAARESSPQAASMTYRATAGVIDPVEDGSYRFTVGLGDSEAVRVETVSVELYASPGDPRAQPVGFAVMAVGFIAFALASRRRRPPPGPSAPPPPAPPRWGRDAGTTRVDAG